MGQPQLFPESGSPNRVEGREFYSPQGIAFDTTSTPPIVYVADAGNNRVLAWKNATGFSNGAPADLVIGQPDAFSTGVLGPGSLYPTGLYAPTGLAVDSKGNLYVADSGNNRVLRYPKPFGQTAGQIMPDLWIGQPSLNSRTANYTGQVSGSGLSLRPGSSPLQAGLAFDGNGNLWVTDPGNNRVLRFPANSLGCTGCTASADLVIGQPNLTTVTTPTLTINQPTTKNQFGVVNNLTFDSLGRLYVADTLSSGSTIQGRVLVFSNPSAQNGNLSADRIVGVIQSSQLTGMSATQLPVFQGETQLGNPEGIFLLADRSLGVVDASLSRITIFPPYEQWPPETTYFSPQAATVIGQPDFLLIHTLPNEAVVGGGALTPPAGAGTLSYTATAAFLSSTKELFISDTGNNRVIVMPQSGSTFLPATRVLGQDNMGQSSPNLIEGKEFNFYNGSYANAAIALDTSGSTPHLWVSDPQNHRVLGFKDARQLSPSSYADIVIGQPDLHTALCNYPTGSSNTPSIVSLCQPMGIAVDGNGSLYVADSGNGRVLRFPNPWTYTGGGMEPADLVLGQAGFTGSVQQPSASTMGTPYGIAFSGIGGLVVSDVQFNRVLYFPFSTNGSFYAGNDDGKAATKVFGQPDFHTVVSGSQTNQLNAPHGIACDSDGQIYVTDTGNNRVLIFGDPNNPQTSAFAPVNISSGLNKPQGVYVNSGTGEIWVTNTGQGTLVKYPAFATLYNNTTATATIQNIVNNTLIPTLAVAQDQYGDLFVADADNRVEVYYQGFTYENGATFLTRPLAPGMWATLTPLASATQFGSNTATASMPFPAKLGDIQVTVNGTPAPLYYVGPGQINFLIPQATPVNTNVEVEVIQASTGQVLGAQQVPITTLAPGLFTSCQANQSGTLREACVLNQDYSLNSATNPAPRGSVVQIFGTGQGLVSNPPADGAPAPSSPLAVTQAAARVIMNTCFTDECGPAQPGDVGTTGSVSGSWVPFSGLAPGLVGMWQVNAQIPMAVPASSSTSGVTLLYVVLNGNAYSADTTSGFRTYFYVK